jgi:hypothetical protein
MARIKIFDTEKANFDIANEKNRRYDGDNKSTMLSINHKNSN